MSNYKEEVDRTERLKTSLGNKVNSIGNIINTKIKEKPTTLTQVEDALKRKMLGVGDTLTDVQILDLGHPSDKNGIFTGHTDRVRALTVDNEFIYSGSEDETIRKWAKTKLYKILSI